MKVYDFGIFKALKQEFNKYGVTNVFNADVSADAVNDNSQCVTINVGVIRQYMKFRCSANIDISMINGSHALEQKISSIVQEFSSHSMPLVLGKCEIGSVCFKPKSDVFDKGKMTLQAFVLLKRIYKDE